MKEKSPMQLETPILYLVFNRPDVVKKTFPLIASQRPKKIFIGADGPRTKKEKIKTEEVRRYILENISWKCEVKTKFSDTNLGCKEAVGSAIDWFFSNIEKGIILEDDCVPSKSFFRFCEEMLERYEKNKKVMSINGYNFLGKLDVQYSYYFSKYFNCIGWATWGDRWFMSDKTMADYREDVRSGQFKKIVTNPLERIWLRRGFERGLSGKAGAWDHPFGYLHIKTGGLCIKPKVNLIGNIGFMEDSTHTSGNFIDNKFYCLKTFNLKFPLSHPKKIKVNKVDSRRFLNKVLLKIFLKKLFFL
jgi:hypothetical protein